MLVPVLSLFYVIASTKQHAFGFRIWPTPSTPLSRSVDVPLRLFAVDPEKEAIALEEASKYVPEKYESTSAKPVDDGFAKAMTAYMAKSHEEKLMKQKIMKEKDDEIEDLKAQLQEMTELANSYQRCLADTIVRYESQLALESTADVDDTKPAEEKTPPATTTVKAEATTPTAEIPAAPPAPVPAPAPAPPVPVAPPMSLYQQRNARLKKGAAAGKSRWGNAEIMKMGGIAQRIQMMPGEEITATKVASAETISEADHGLWREGILSLADRITYGSDLIFAKPTIEDESTTTHPEAGESLYEKRNAKLLEVAESGKSRWGVDEINRVKDIVAGIDQPSVAAATVTESQGVKSTNEAVASATMNGTPKPVVVEEKQEPKVAVAAVTKPSEGAASTSVAANPTPKPKVVAQTGQANYFSDDIAYGSGWGNYGSG